MTPHECRDHAAACEAKAHAIHDAEIKAALNDVARQWRALADHIESKAKGTP